MAPWPTVTSSPILVGSPVSIWTTALSWILERGPMTMRLMSPRKTAPYQTLDSFSSVTSPMTVAAGTTHARPPSRRAHAVRFLRSGGQTLAAIAPDSVGWRSVIFSRDSAVRANTFCCAADAGSLRAAAVKGPTQGFAKRKPGWTSDAELIALAEIRRGPAGGKKTRRASASPSGAPAQKISGQRSPARLLHQRRSLQLCVARAACGANYPSLPGVDGGDQ